MKRLIQTILAVGCIVAGLFFVNHRLNAVEGFSGADTITVYNWGDYIDPDLLKKFKEETGLTVVYETFDSNEAMLVKIEQGGTTYDVAVPSEYMINKMIEEDLLIPLDHEKLPNLKHIDPRFMDLVFDPKNKYSMPYFWGTVGIIYNPDRLGDIPLEKWDDLWNPALENEILLIDGAREVIGFSLNRLHYSLNTLDKEQLLEAKEQLDLLTPNVKAIVGDEMDMLMVNNEASLGVIWSGNAADMMWQNEALDYVVPAEGSNIFFDNMVIPKTAKNIEGAHKFIDFMLRPENAAQNAEYVGYSTPNLSALELMDPEIVNDERFYPPDELVERLEVYENLGKRNLAYYNELFLEFKMHKK